MKKIAFVLATTTLITGCATLEKVTIAPTVASAMQGKTVALTTRGKKPDFSALTPAKGALGLMGAIAAVSAGNDLILKNDVPVPADAIGLALGQQLQSARGMQLVATPITVVSDEIEQVVAAVNGQANYILDVQTTGWMSVYYPLAWGRYRVIHSAQARLIDTASKQIVAQGACMRTPDAPDSAPTYDELMNNKAEGLKKELAIAAAECVSVLKRDMLAL